MPHLKYYFFGTSNDQPRRPPPLHFLSLSGPFPLYLFTGFFIRRSAILFYTYAYIRFVIRDRNTKLPTRCRINGEEAVDWRR
ncbi:unnamed protein product [Chondrus crispus]|uniref:Uncharacterized protein n=1 Tax=Chondrus crispus TaxID=2769 RepID=R7Q6J6_CHOCR|nr:unnamed protein product [Chondrus crispus]CDF34167.1 unnamed protein product [Chondrus crispus]|eukprot:XP_005713986.1 unnamed protein product [Chondrus crispus]